MKAGKTAKSMTRRECLQTAGRYAVGLAALPTVCARGGAADVLKAEETKIELAHSPEVFSHIQAPFAAEVRVTEPLRRAAAERRLCVRDKTANAALIPAQLLAESDKAKTARLCWLMPKNATSKSHFVLALSKHPAPPAVHAALQSESGQYEILEGEKRVLRYNYATVDPADRLVGISADNQKYAAPRSDYIHPLYGLNGEELTRDWSKDHPHHRGIYWAWPEVDWNGRRGDLHALQQVFARPTGRCAIQSGPVFAQIDAENLWKWEEGTGIVRERAILRAYRSGAQGRWIDLEFEFTAMEAAVQLARRGTSHYGGLNLRFNSIQGQQIVKYADPADAAAQGASPTGKSRKAWGEISGVFGTAAQPAGVVILQHAGNPGYPGDWTDYPELNWLQPTFPAAGTRHTLKPGEPLVLRFRLWIHHGGAAPVDALSAQWLAVQSAGAPQFFGSNTPSQPASPHNFRVQHAK